MNHSMKSTLRPAMLLASVFGMADSAPREAIPEIPKVRRPRLWRGDHARECSRRRRQIERRTLKPTQAPHA